MLMAIGMVISDTLRGGKASLEIRYYILSKRMSARRFATAVRGHWGIENRLHWQLDVTFGEDLADRQVDLRATFARVNEMLLDGLQRERCEVAGQRVRVEFADGLQRIFQIRDFAGWPTIFDVVPIGERLEPAQQLGNGYVRR
jgi:hypothetical protein